MKISNETKVGVLTITALVVLILGFNFLKGKDLFNKSKKIYAVFDNLGALSKSNEVKINGFTIGNVYDLEAIDKNVSGIKVTINLTKDVNIPSNSVAHISAPLAGLGSSVILIDKGDATTYLQDGDKLETRVDKDMFSGLSSEVSPTLAKIRTSLDSLNVVFSNINRFFDANTKGNLQQMVSNLNAATASLNKMMDPDKGPLAATLRNTSSITDNLKKNNDSITAILSNTKQLTAKLAQLDLKEMVDTIQAVLSKLKSTITKMSSSDGTLGALINDKKLYTKMNDVALSLELLLDDIRVHPKRYTGNIIFNRKDRTGPLTSPQKKDSTQ